MTAGRNPGICWRRRNKDSFMAAEQHQPSFHRLIGRFLPNTPQFPIFLTSGGLFEKLRKRHAVRFAENHRSLTGDFRLLYKLFVNPLSGRRTLRYYFFTRGPLS